MLLRVLDTRDLKYWVWKGQLRFSGSPRRGPDLALEIHRQLVGYSLGSREERHLGVPASSAANGSYMYNGVLYCVLRHGRVEWEKSRVG